MACTGYSDVWQLTPHELVGIDGGRGATLRVTRGTLWLTFEHDTRDVVLGTGDVFTIDSNGLTLAEAQGATTVCVMARHARALRLRQPAATLAARVRRWLGEIAAAGMARRFVPYV